MSQNTTNKVLLIAINAKYIHSNPAVYSLKAYADKYYADRPDGCVLEIAEYTINQHTETILADIYRHRPQIAAFSCYIWNWTNVQELLMELPKVLPDTSLWIGGPEVSFHADMLIHAFPQLAGIMVGEGEETFLELLHYYWENRKSILDIKGIVCKEGFTGERGLVDINRLPFLYTPAAAYCASADSEAANSQIPAHSIPAAFQNRIIYYESQRGCPFQCAYCLSSIDKKVRLRNIDTVKSELRYFLDHSVPQVKFIDRTFNCSQEHALSIWKYLKENDNGVTNFHFEIAADLLTDEHLAVMRGMRPGLIQLEIGVQSANEETLKAINRHMDMSTLRKTVAVIHSFRNIHQHLDLIAGLPYEDYDSFADSFDTVYAMAPDQLQLGFLKVLKGSPMEQCASKYGIVYSSKPPYEVLYTRWLCYDDLLKLKGIEEMVELYYNSNQFTHTLPVLAQHFASPFRMYEALADYYRTNGFFTSTPARSYRYQVLLNFACSVAADNRALFAELLTFDLYLRENLKSRPDFAPVNIPDRDKVRSFYENEKQAPQFLKEYDGYTSVQILRMTHIEQFSYPVWKECPTNCVEKLETPAYVLFNYKERSALTHDAKYYEITLS
ncbi:MAG: B12-binding domain-containing radical SAM protein [Lachnospiraceae bacterium]|nr:B12-binding domain-containing radical SAM protein [Lachnospiraceae bacterium]